MNSFATISIICVLILEIWLARTDSQNDRYLQHIRKELLELGMETPDIRTIPEWKWNLKNTRMPKLSRWQFIVLNDVIIEITLSKCHDLNKTICESLKYYLQDQVAKAPYQISIDDNFFPLYKDLGDCLDGLTNKNSKSFMMADMESGTSWNETQRAEPNSRTFEYPKLTLQKVVESTLILVSQVVNSTAELFMNSDNRSKRSSDDRITIAKQEFSDLIRTMISLVRQTCQFSKSTTSQQVRLSSQIGNQMIDWIVMDKDGIVTAAKYFFKNSKILKKIKYCYLNGGVTNRVPEKHL